MNRERDKKHKTEHRRVRNVKQKEGIVMPVPISKTDLPHGYANLLASLKKRIQQERIKAVLSANKALVMMYWDIGNSIIQKQNNEGWGSKIIDRLSHDLKDAFPEMRGFSPRNLKYMRKFAKSWRDRQLVQRTVALIPWRSNLAKYALAGYTKPIGVAEWER
ncbi:MAG TPA: DUF1016 N-terminal domain-containing protein, partial [Anaerolineae bacterium]|nr:DUF1016 N-terminal domain-containing protein [Anaerolineae bacterium]